MNKIERNASFGSRAAESTLYRRYGDAPEGAVDMQLETRAKQPVNLDALAAQLSIGAVPLRQKQGIFYPKKMVLLLSAALNIAPPPALVVQFDIRGRKATFPIHA